ncbi:lysylphosphatidylglycerol synthase transmembrane domain-containing protein [Phycisphaeraceae bacterium D3-23]
MKKHLGTIFRLAIAAAGITFLIMNLNWSDQVHLPAGYVAGPGMTGGEAGASYSVLEETDSAYRIGYRVDKPRQDVWINKSELTTDGEGPRFKPSFATTVRQADGKLLLLGLLLLSPIYLIGAARWYLLMRVRGMDVTPVKTFRLTMVGVFFNLCMPGATGGDVMKAYYAAKGSSQRSVAVMSVIVDRACGLLGLVLLVALVGLTMLDHPVVRRITLFMWAALIGVVLFAWLYSHPTLRRKVGFDWLMNKLPGGGMLRNLDSAAVAYGNHKRALLGAVLMSLPVHGLVALSIATAGYALGITQPVDYLMGTVPVAVLVGSLPISGPLGLGPMDVVTVGLLADGVRATAHQVAMMMVIYRGYAIVLGLLGALGLLKGGIHLHPQAEEEAGGAGGRAEVASDSPAEQGNAAEPAPNERSLSRSA